MRTLYKHRQEVLVAEMRKTVGGLIEINEADAGMHLVGWLAAGVDDTEISQKAAASGLFAAPLSNYGLNQPLRGGLLLGYTAFEEKEIKRGVRILATILG
jgi:GntR family transcriptional regulator/MocR family aminotransferase